MKRITVRELRQNPAPMVQGLEAGESYVLIKRDREIATIVPMQSSAEITPAKRQDGEVSFSLSAYELSSASSVHELLDDEKGDR